MSILARPFWGTRRGTIASGRAKVSVIVPKRCEGIVLLVVLWIMVVLTILGLGYFHLSSLEIRTSRNDMAKFQARMYAESAVQSALSLLVNDQKSSEIDTLSDSWSGLETSFEAVAIGDGVYQIYTDNVYDEEGGTLFGLRDESSKLNINVATRAMMERLPGMTSAMAAAIIDWRDADNNAMPGGAENEVYNALSPPYNCANRPLPFLSEILLVRGFDTSHLYGEDSNQDGIMQSVEDDGDTNDPPDNQDGKLDRGLYPYMTVYSYDLNTNKAGDPRLDINTVSLEDLKTRLSDIGEDKLQILLESRDKEKWSNLGDLVGIESEQPSNNTEANPEKDDNQFQKNMPANFPYNYQEWESLLGELKCGESSRQEGLVNINTAPQVVLECLPGVNATIAERIITQRQSENGAFRSIAELAKIDGMNSNRLKRVIPWVTVRSQVFEAMTIGYSNKTQAYAASHAVIDRGSNPARFVYYRILR